MIPGGRGLGALAAFAAILGVGLSQSVATGDARMSVGYESSGRGWISAGSGEHWKWEACRPRWRLCVSLGSGYWRRKTHRTRPGTLFRAIGDDGEVESSPRWRGRLQSVRPPSVRGEVRANEIVTPVYGRWKGGWEGSKHLTQLAACPAQSDEGCTTLTHTHYGSKCPNGGAVLDPVFAGQYLRVADGRAGPRHKVFANLVPSPYGYDVWSESPIVSVAFLGQIQPAAGPRTATCGPPPLEASPTQ